MLSYEKRYASTWLANELEFNFKNIDNEGKGSSEIGTIFHDSEEVVKTAEKVNKELISKLEAIFIVDELKGINEDGIKNYDFNSLLIVTIEEFERIISNESLKEVVNSAVKVIDLRRN